MLECCGCVMKSSCVQLNANDTGLQMCTACLVW